MRFPDLEGGYPELIHPNPMLPITNAIAGVIIVAMVMASALLASSVFLVIAQFVDALHRDNGLAYAFAMVAQMFGVKRGATSYEIFRFVTTLTAIVIFILFYVPFALRAFWFGVGKIGQALLQWRNSGVPDGVPEDLNDQMGVLRKMVRREKYTNDWKTGAATALFGLNVQFLSPLATDIAKVIAARVSNWFGQLFRIVFGAAAVSGLIVWIFGMPSNYSGLIGLIADALHASGLWPSLTMGLSPFAFMAALTVVITLLEHTFVALLVPKRGWPADSLTSGDRVVASTPPNLISLEFPLRIEGYRSADEPNRIYKLTDEAAATSVSETGNFILLGVIEQQPQFIGNPNHRASRFWLVSGWALVLLGLAVQLFFLVPPSLREVITANRLPDAVYTLTPVVQLLFIGVGIHSFSNGRRMIAEAELLYASYWFASSAIGYQIRGTTSRSEVNVGRGQMDSIHTSSTVYRSEFLYDLTTTTILSESVTLDGVRQAVGMQNTQESKDFLDAGVYELRKIVETRAAPIRVNLEDQGLREQVQVNATIEAMKAGQIEAMRLQARRDAAGKNLTARPEPRQLPTKYEP